MNVQIEDDWAVLDPSVTHKMSVKTTAHEITTKTGPAHNDCTIDKKSDVDNMKDCFSQNSPMKKPGIVPQDSFDSEGENLSPLRRTGGICPEPKPCYRQPILDHKVLPVPPPSPTLSHLRRSLVNSSTQLLAKVDCEDGIIELPPPSIGQVYLATYPFSNIDVNGWSWIFGAGIEDKFIVPTAPIPHTYAQQSRSATPEYFSRNDGLPFAFLSRALDTAVVPEDTKHIVRFLIVVKKSTLESGAKLIVVESRKAAGMLIYYELLKGACIPFVGATTLGYRSGEKNRYKRVNSLDEAAALYNRGVIGIIC